MGAASPVCTCQRGGSWGICDGRYLGFGCTGRVLPSMFLGPLAGCSCGLDHSTSWWTGCILERGLQSWDWGLTLLPCCRRWGGGRGSRQGWPRWLPPTGWRCACGAVPLWCTPCWSLWCQDRVEGAPGLFVCGSFGAVLWGPWWSCFCCGGYSWLLFEQLYCLWVYSFRDSHHPSPVLGHE